MNQAADSEDDDRRKLLWLFAHGHHDDPSRFQPDLAGVQQFPPEGWLWSGDNPHPSTAFGLRDEGAYSHVSRHPLLLHRSPEKALTADTPGSMDRSEATGTETPAPEQVEEYLRHSVDVTMKGGTTSGVVYPLALCEIARRAVLRNVGGASAGAIAAAAAAAAEVGRAARITESKGQVPVNKPAREGHRVRAGFVGLADVAAWLCEADRADSAPQAYRLGQLFGPTAAARRMFRVAVAMMRQKYSRVPILLLGTLGRWTGLATFVLLLLDPALLARTYSSGGTVPGGQPGARPTHGWLPEWLAGYLVSVAWLLCITLVIVSVVVLLTQVLGWFRHRVSVPPELAEPVLTTDKPRPPVPVLAAVTLVLGLALGAVLVATSNRVDPWRAMALWFAMVVGILVAQLLSLLYLINRARGQRFGLIAGSSGPVTGDAQLRQARRLLDVFAGLPRESGVPNLLDWLSDVFSDLAGLPDGEVLRFGHLWQGRDFSVNKDQTLLVHASRNSTARLVNLELMTSELVHGVPMRFPLPVDAVRDANDRPTMFVRRSDLEGKAGQILPPAVVDAVCAGRPVVGFDTGTGTAIDDLYPLPLPWDLPIAFAVRMSMSFPVLFQVIRLYRVRGSEEVRNNFGVRLGRDGQLLHYPAENQTPRQTENPAAQKIEIQNLETQNLETRILETQNLAGAEPASTNVGWVEELWIGDGGITSNFPIHFFDRLLPRWPTLGINLGDFPRGAAQQSVWLPTDAAPVETSARAIGRSLIGYLGGVLNTGLGWRDTVQTTMPAFRGRIATVRVGPGEGGNNLFMNRDQVAGLALRGATAGVRLSRRFADDGQWHRHQWLRLRVAMGNFHALNQETRSSLGASLYQRAVDEGAAVVTGVQHELRDSCDPAPPFDQGPGGERPMPWYEPIDHFWQAMDSVLAAQAHAPGRGLTKGAPQPAPELRQVPRT